MNPSFWNHVLQHRCGQCGADPGEACNAPIKGGFHIRRQDAAVACERKTRRRNA